MHSENDNRSDEAQTDETPSDETQSDETQSSRANIYRGHDLEAGVLSRVREWVDLFPWLRLGRTLRVAASPPLVFFVAVTFVVWQFGTRLIFGVDGGGGLGVEPLAAENGPTVVFVYFGGAIMTTVDGVGTSLPWWRILIVVAWSVFIWSPAAILLARQGGLLTAGRRMTPLKAGVSLAIRRSPAAWLSAIVPLACVLAMGIFIVVVGWVSRLVVDVRWVETLLALIVAVIAIPCGVLAFGAIAAVPLSWAALANERDPDALDSLSRGYEYLFRRPLQLVLYVAISLVILLIVGMLATGVALAASSVATTMLSVSGASPAVGMSVMEVLGFLPIIVLLTLLWSLFGGVYLLLRYEAGGQEVEDLWEPAPHPQPPLPEIPPS